MIAIGLRVYSNSNIFYTIIEKDENGNLIYKSISNIFIPNAMEPAEQLNYVRNTLFDIIAEYSIEQAVVRVSEANINLTQNAIERFYVDGVILESLAASYVFKYRMGKIATITMLLNINREKFKLLTENKAEFEFLPEDMEWKFFTSEQRESILSCHAALNL
jgi:hypothetical protein